MPGLRPKEALNRSVPDGITSTEGRQSQAVRLGQFRTESLEDTILSPGDNRRQEVFSNDDDFNFYVGHASCRVDPYGHTFDWGIELVDQAGDNVLAESRTNIGSDGYINLEPPWPVRDGEEVRIVLRNNTKTEVTATGAVVMWSEPGRV